MMFRDRIDAALQLAGALKKWRDRHPLVLAIPRGAVPMGKIIADALAGDLDVVMTRKLRAPHNPEFAIGAVDESGWSHVEDHAERYGADEDYIVREIAFQREVIRHRRERYVGVPPISPRGRVVIVVDDGLATGATMIAALHAIRLQAPERLIAAVPVAPLETERRIALYADEVLCLQVPEHFMSIGQFYRNFPSVEDDEAIAILQSARRSHDAPSTGNRHGPTLSA